MCAEHANRRAISLGFTDESFPEGQHICYIYKDDAERRRVMAKYMQSGLLAHEKVLYLVDAMTTDAMLDCLEELGVDARSKSAELTMADAASTYCPNGTFNTEEMLDTVRDFYVQATEKEDFAGARVAGEASWCLVEGRTDFTSLMQYEARVNLLLDEFPITACCQYDARRFDGNTIMDVLSVHPVMIVRGQLVKNPYYVQPETFLSECRAQATERQGA